MLMLLWIISQIKSNITEYVLRLRSLINFY